MPYAILSGFGGVLVVDQVLDALTGHFVALWDIGALLVAAAVHLAAGAAVATAGSHLQHRRRAPAPAPPID